MRYRTAAALEMAVRDAAKASPQDTNRAIAGFYFHQHRDNSEQDGPYPVIPLSTIRLQLNEC